MRDEVNLYTKVKRYIARNIYDGTYEEGMRIPSERDLSEALGVSRVTIRKSLQELEKDNLLTREVGVGTKIRFSNSGHGEEAEIINLVAPARNPFFTDFIEEFQQVLDREDVLLSYVQKSKGKSIEDCLFRLYQRGLHNAVIWLQDMRIDIEKIKRLRALGMNMTFFDAEINAPYADCIYLDNDNAMKELVNAAHKKQACKTYYIGWDNENMFSVAERESAYLKYAKTGTEVCKIPWNERRNPDKCVNDVIEEVLKSNKGREISLICGDGELGRAAGKSLLEKKSSKAELFSIDEFAGAKDFGITTIDQNFKEEAALAWDTINNQTLKPDEWKAKTIKVKGKLILREKPVC